MNVLLLLWNNKSIVLLVSLLLVVGAADYKIKSLKQDIAVLNQQLGGTEQQIAQMEATISSLSSYKAHTDEIASKVGEAIADEKNKARIALQGVLKASKPKYCVGSIEYLKNEASNVGFE